MISTIQNLSNNWAEKGLFGKESNKKQPKDKNINQFPTILDKKLDA